MFEDRVLAAFLRPAKRLRTFGAVLLLLLGYLGVGVFDHELWPPTEQAMAGVAWEMYESGDLTLPQINGMAYLEKPPLAYVLSWAAFIVGGGPSAGLLRLPAALAGVGCLLIVFRASRRLYGEPTAWACTLMCALTANFWSITHRASTDSIAMLCTILCLALFLRTLPRPADAEPVPEATSSVARPNWQTDIPFCLALALSFYVKNLFTTLLVLPPAAILLLATRDYRRLAIMSAWLALCFGVALAPWCWALYAKGGWEYLRIVFFDNTLGRYTNIGPLSGTVLAPLNDAFVVAKATSPRIVLSAFPVQTVPWVLLQPIALWAFFRRRTDEHWRLFLKLALVSMVVAITLSASRTETYYRPTIFVLCLITGDYIRSAYQSPSSASARRVILANWLLVALLLAALPIGAARALGLPGLAWIAVPSTAAFVAAWLLLRHRWAGQRASIAWGSLCAGVAFVTVAVLIPKVDSVHAWRPFFEAVQSRVDGSRTLSTAIVDDSLLPAINFYLDRRVEMVSADHVPELLRSGEDVGVIVTATEYDRLQPTLAAIPHREVRPPRGVNRYVYLESEPDAAVDLRGMGRDPQLAAGRALPGPGVRAGESQTFLGACAAQSDRGQRSCSHHAHRHRRWWARFGETPGNPGSGTAPGNP